MGLLNNRKAGSALVAAVAAAMVVVSVAAATHSVARQTAATWPPLSYRFAGWMSAVGTSGIVTHAFSEGDSVLAEFRNASAPARTVYRLCVRRGSGRASCRSESAHSDHVSTVRLTQWHLKIGRYTSWWVVDGKVVARWPFIFSSESP
jgi:hypothetical protein